MRHDDRRIARLRIVVRRGVDVGGDIQTVERVLDRVDIDLARLVSRDRTVIDQGERILPVTPTSPAESPVIAASRVAVIALLLI
jgi:hypothetical protein